MLIIGEHQTLSDVMFHANDELKHDVYWSKIGQCWSIENLNGHIESYARMDTALAAMRRFTNTTPSYDWSVTVNPYS